MPGKTQIVLYIAASVDGFIADAGGGVGWLPQVDGGGDYGYGEFYAGVDALVMGRRTYEQVLGFGEWPYGGKAAYVFTNHPPDGGPAGVEFVRMDPARFVSRVASRYSGVVWLVGGANLAGQFLRAGLIDEFRVFVIPVILGQGVPLFGGNGGGGGATALRLEVAQTWDGGVVELRYRPAPAGRPA